MKRLISVFITSFFVCLNSYAADYNQNGQTHRVVYVITDASGNPVAGQTVRLAVERASDGKFRDFADGTFKSSGWTARFATMSYDTTGEYYGYDIKIDGGTLISGDYVCIVSNDDVTYGDQQAEVVKFDSLSQIIKINR